MSIKKRGLGRGLHAIIGGDEDLAQEEKLNTEDVKQQEVDKQDIKQDSENFINIAFIEPNKNQPRKEFNKEELEELASSIRQYGIIQPIIVRKKGEYYEIIAGERRWRAAQEAGLKEVPVIIKDYSEQLAKEISLIENIQRADLNPIEEARAYQSLLDDYGYRHEELALRMAKSRASISNSVRLLKLDEYVQTLMIEKKLSSGHARALLTIENKEIQKKIADEVIAKRMSVRELEKYVKGYAKPKKVRPNIVEEIQTTDYSIFYKDYENKLKDLLGTKVFINKKDKNKGRIEIEYYSFTELERLVELMRHLEQM